MSKTFKHIPLPYTKHIEHWFGPLAKEPGAIWLDSAHHPQGQYDVFTAQPLLTLTLDGAGQYTLRGANLSADLQAIVKEHQTKEATKQRATEAFELIKKLRRALFGHEKEVKAESLSLPSALQRWLPGVLGLLSYSLGAIDQPVKHSEQWPALSLGFYGWLVVSDHTQKSAWLIYHRSLMAPFEQELIKLVSAFKKPVVLAAPPKPAQLNAQAIQAINDFNAPKPDARYLTQFQQVQALLLAGDCYQINLARRLEFPYYGDAFDLYCHIRPETQAPYSGYLKLDAGECLCFSPEHFLTLTTQGTIYTSPIKGTSPRGATEAKDQAAREALEQSEKDHAENLMIVDLLRNDLGRICQAGTITVPKLMALESFATVHHLVSEVRGELQPNGTAEDMLEATFPGGSITGAPKVRALQIIDALEPHSRDAFCGSLCHIGANNTLEANICIRTATKHHDQLTLWAGGGIVIDSQVESEWTETQWKINKILASLMLEDS